jgi:hypothetical protein
MTENGEHVVDGVHGTASGPTAGPTGAPVDAVARVDLHRARQAASGAEVHPDAALLAARLARVVGDPAARPVAVPAAGVAGPGVAGPGVARPGVVGTAGLTAVAGTAAAASAVPVVARPGPVVPAALAGLAGPAVTDSDASTVKLTTAAGAPARPHPRPSPRPRGVAVPGRPGTPGVAVPGKPGTSGVFGVVEGAASATTKAPATDSALPIAVPALPVALPAVPVLAADVADPGGPVDAALRDPSVARALPPVRDAAFAAAPVPAAVPPSFPPGVLDVVALPAAPALVCDPADRIVQVNAALLRLAGRTSADLDGGLHGRRLLQLVVGPDTDARLVRADGALVRVRVVRWDVPGRDRKVVVFVEMLDAYAAELGDADQRRWTAELERMARVGTWRYELATGTLHRSESLQELYRGMGIEPDGSGGPVEGEQVALLVRALRSGTPTPDHRAELALPGVRLSCRAEVELGPDGVPNTRRTAEKGFRQLQPERPALRRP